MSAAAKPGQVLAIVCAGVVLANLDLFIVNVALPDIARDFGNASLSALSWILNGYAIVYAALLVFCGRLAERYPRTNDRTSASKAKSCRTARPTVPIRPKHTLTVQTPNRSGPASTCQDRNRFASGSLASSPIKSSFIITKHLVETQHGVVSEQDRA
jgi:MFS family permease